MCKDVQHATYHIVSYHGISYYLRITFPFLADDLLAKAFAYFIELSLVTAFLYRPQVFPTNTINPSSGTGFKLLYRI